MGRTKETESSGETTGLTPEQKVFKYAEFLLYDSKGNPKKASSERLEEEGTEPGVWSSQAKFYMKDGGYYIDEYRNGDMDDLLFVTYMKPHPERNPKDPASPK